MVALSLVVLMEYSVMTSQYLALEQLVEHVCQDFTRLNRNVLVSINYLESCNYM